MPYEDVVRLQHEFRKNEPHKSNFGLGQPSQTNSQKIANSLDLDQDILRYRRDHNTSETLLIDMPKSMEPLNLGVDSVRFPGLSRGEDSSEMHQALDLRNPLRSLESHSAVELPLQRGADIDHGANRRRKKRPSYGVRTVDILRGRGGFGFTLSGQNPCILSSVIPGSPADTVGLKSGDCVIAVNGRNVSKTPHNEVVRCIGQSPGTLKLQIAENYCEDSSSEDEARGGVRLKPKYPHRRAGGKGKVGEGLAVGKVGRIVAGKEKVLAEIHSNNIIANAQVHNLHEMHSDHEEYMERGRTAFKPVHVRGNSADSTFTETSIQPKQKPRRPSPKKSLPNHRLQSQISASHLKNVQLGASDELNLVDSELARFLNSGDHSALGDFNSFLNPTLSDLRKSMKIHNQRKHNIDVSSAELKCVTGYLGTIEMPKGIDSGSSAGLQEIRNCVRRLRIEKKVHTMVLLCIFPERIALINHHGLKLAEYKAENISFCGAYADDRRFFGLVTSQVEGEGPEGVDDKVSSSCHVFMVEAIASQEERRSRAKAFQIDLSYDENNQCKEFPSNADPILAVIYALRGVNEGAQEAGGEEAGPNPEEASTTSASGSSNSDSGIGFRDDVLVPQGPERALVLDVPGERIRLQNISRIQEQQQQALRQQQQEQDRIHQEHLNLRQQQEQERLDREHDSLRQQIEQDRVLQDQQQNFHLSHKQQDQVLRRQFEQQQTQTQYRNMLQKRSISNPGGSFPTMPHNVSISSSEGSVSDRNLVNDFTVPYPPSSTVNLPYPPSTVNPPLGASSTIPSIGASVSTSRLTVRAMPDPSSADASFNTDRLESLQSADNIRLSMQKYLQDKREHLKKTSQQMVERRRQAEYNSSGGSSQRTAGGLHNPPSEGRHRVARTSSLSDRSFVRSMEDIRSVTDGEDYSGPELGHRGPPSLPVGHIANLPLARFLYSSDSNLSQLDVPSGGWANTPTAVELAQNHPLNRWQKKQGGGTIGSTVLRPCDQYPVEPGHQKPRPRSQMSTKTESSTHHSVESDYDNVSFKEENIRRGSRNSSVKNRLPFRSSTSSRQLPKYKDPEEDPDFDLMSLPGQDDIDERLSKLDPETLSQRSQPDLSRDAKERLSQSGSHGSPSCKDLDIGRVGSWAADFDKLLGDSAGLQTFAEFLKKEFSHENIYFWCVCEKYSGTQDGVERMKISEAIMERHLAVGAVEPVNIDSVARSTTQEALMSATRDNPPDKDLFLAAQKQIYNLMKFDSFSRFLKSDVYKECLLADMAGKDLPYNGVDGVEEELQVNPEDEESKDKSKKSKDVEVRRKSLLPWNNLNIRNRSKSKDRAEQNTSDTKPTTSIFKSRKSTQPSTSSSKSDSPEKNDKPGRISLSAGDLGRVANDSSGDQSAHRTESCTRESCMLTRVILPDKATTVVNTSTGESIRALVSRLLDKRGLKFTSFDVFRTGSELPLDLSSDCSNLGCTEVRVEPRVLFRLELPSRKSIGVKAKQTKLVEDVLRPILQQYGWNLDLMTIRLDGDNIGNKEIDLRANVTIIDNSRLVVCHKTKEEMNSASRVQDENIINRSGDSDMDSRSVRTDSRPGSRGSSQMGLSRMSSGSLDLKRFPEDESGLMPPPARIPTAKKKPMSLPRDQEVLYEGLKRMTKGRLDDQRGTEINMELPEFLKTRDNQSRASEPYNMAGRLDARLSGPPDMARDRLGNSGMLNDLTNRLSGPAELERMHGQWDSDHASRYIDYIDSTFTSDGFVPTLEEADDFFNAENPDESMCFNESKLSLGMGRPSLGYDGMRVVSRPSIGTVGDYASYESLAVYRTGTNNPHVAPGYAQPPPTAPKPRLVCVEEGHEGKADVVPKRPPPPLPPKPVRGPPPLPPHPHTGGPLLQHPHNEQIPVTRTQNGVFLGIPGEKGYSVSFV